MQYASFYFILSVERLMYLGGAPGYKTRMVSVGVSERALCPWLGGSIVGECVCVFVRVCVCVRVRGCSVCECISVKCTL